MPVNRGSKMIIRESQDLSCLLGSNINRARRMRGLSLLALAQATNIKLPTLEAYEAGAKRVSAPDLISIVVACDVTISSMFED